MDVKTQDTNFQSKYFLADYIDSGKYGKVYLYIDSTNGTKVAVKIIKCTMQNCFLIDNEIEVLEKLKTSNVKSPFIINYIECYRTLKNVKLVTEYFSATSIASLIQKKLVLPNPSVNVKKIALQIFHGIGVLHLLGIVHRDIKAENILFDPFLMRIKILDFGISRLFPSEIGDNRDLLKKGFQLGTREYWPPEFYWYSFNKKNILSFEEYQKVDVFAIGILLCELLFGELFQGELYTEEQRLNAEEKAIFSYPGKINFARVLSYLDEADIADNTNIKKLIELCLSPYPDQRPTIEKIVRLITDRYYGKKLNC